MAKPGPKRVVTNATLVILLELVESFIKGLVPGFTGCNDPSCSRKPLVERPRRKGTLSWKLYQQGRIVCHHFRACNAGYQGHCGTPRQVVVAGRTHKFSEFAKACLDCVWLCRACHRDIHPCGGRSAPIGWEFETVKKRFHVGGRVFDVPLNLRKGLAHGCEPWGGAFVRRR